MAIKVIAQRREVKLGKNPGMSAQVGSAVHSMSLLQ